MKRVIFWRYLLLITIRDEDFYNSKLLKRLVTWINDTQVPEGHLFDIFGYQESMYCINVIRFYLEIHIQPLRVLTSENVDFIKPAKEYNIWEITVQGQHSCLDDVSRKGRERSLAYECWRILFAVSIVKAQYRHFIFKNLSSFRSKERWDTKQQTVLLEKDMTTYLWVSLPNCQTFYNLKCSRNSQFSWDLLLIF